MTRKFLEGLGLDKEMIDSIMQENGRDIENARTSEKNSFEAERKTLQEHLDDLQGQITARDADLVTLRGQIEAAQSDAGRLAEAQNALSSLQSRYEEERSSWEQKMAQQAYDFAIRTEAEKLKFSSAAARREFIREATEKAFKMDGDKLLGFGDFVEGYRKSDPSAFAPEAPEGEAPPQPKIVLPSGQNGEAKPTVFGFHFNGVRKQSGEETS